MSERPLFTRCPQLAVGLPWLRLGDFPTPVERLHGLSRHSGLRELYVKRDDRSGEPYGGNKVRKLEFLLAAAKSGGHTRLLTIGAQGSHQILATTLYAAQQGMTVCALVLPQPATAHAEAVLARTTAAGACLHAAGGPLRLPLAVLGWLRRHGRERPFWIGPGGSSALGSLGYVNAALELAEQVQAGHCPRPDRIVVTLGSGGTAAGLLVGLRLAGFDSTRLLAVGVCHPRLSGTTRLLALANRTAALIRRWGGPELGRFTPADLDVTHAYYGEGYGQPLPDGTLAAEVMASAEGIPLDPTYTAKTVAGLLASAGDWSGQRVLYWHTLAAPADADGAGAQC